MKTSMTVTMSQEIDDALTMIACARGITKAEAMLRAFALEAMLVGLLPTRKSPPPAMSRQERHRLQRIG